MNMVRHFNHSRKQTAYSPQGSFAYNENLQQQTSYVNITIEIFALRFFFFFDH